MPITLTFNCLTAMSRSTSFVTALLCTVALASAPAESSVLRIDNTYAVGLSDSQGGYSRFDGLRFDGRSHYLGRTDSNGNRYVNVMIRETEEDLGEGRHRLALDLINPHHTASGLSELFPIAPEEGSTPDLGIGIHFGTDPFDLIGPLRLDAVNLRLYIGGEVVSERSLLELWPTEFGSVAPWDGGLFTRFDGVGFRNGRGLGIGRVEWEFLVSEIPQAVSEPSSLASVGLGILALGWRLRRRDTKASLS